MPETSFHVPGQRLAPSHPRGIPMELDRARPPTPHPRWVSPAAKGGRRPGQVFCGGVAAGTRAFPSCSMRWRGSHSGVRWTKAMSRSRSRLRRSKREST